MSAGPPIHKLLEPSITKYLLGDDTALETSKRIKSIIDEQAQVLPTQIAFSSLMSKLVVCGLDLLNFNDPRDLTRHKIAGLIVFDCLIDVNDEITPERRIEIANHICKVLENDKIPLSANEQIIRTGALCIGHFGRIASTNEIEFLQNFCFPLALKLLTNSRSESHRFSGTVLLTQLAQNTPALIFSKRKVLFNTIWDIVSDKNPLVRASAAEALETALQLTSQREAMTEYVTMALKQMDAGFMSTSTEKTIGALIILDILVKGSVVSIADLQGTLKAQGSQSQDILWKVFKLRESRDAEVRQKVVELIPSLASAFTATFMQPNNNTAPLNYVSYAIKHFTDMIIAKKERHFAYIALGRLFVALSHQLRSSSHVQDIFATVRAGFRDPFCTQALQCLGMIVNVSAACRKLVDTQLVDLMFRGGLSVQLTDTLKIVIKHVPSVRRHAQTCLRTHITSILNRYTVLIDEVRGRPASARYMRQGAQSSQSISASGGSNSPGAPRSASKWNSGPSSLFGSLKPENLSIASAASGLAVKPESELVFALETLSCPEFFPKQGRDRSTSDRGAGGSSDDADQCVQLLQIVREGVVRYLDDYSPEIRGAAAKTCAVLLDVVVLSIDPHCSELNHMYQVLDRLLIMAVGDDSQVLRASVFDSLSPSLDHLVALTENVHCLVEALNDESLQVRAAAMTVMSRVAHFDSLHVMPVVRLSMKRLILALSDSRDLVTKQESVLLLQALVRGSDVLIVPYVKQVIGPLMALLNDPCAEVVVAALSTIGELAMASPESVREHLNSLTLRLIAALNDQSSLLKQEAAVIVMGKLVSSLTMETDEPYKKYSGLFDGLIRAIQSVDGSVSAELRLQAIKTLGLLGAVDMNTYQRRLASDTAVVDDATVVVEQEEAEDDGGNASEDVSEEVEGADEEGEGRRKLTSMEKYHFSVVVRELVAILRDSSLSSYHQTAASIAVRNIHILGGQTPHLRELMDGITFRLYQADTGNNLKEMLLDHVITIVQIVGNRRMRSHLISLASLASDFFESNLQQCLDLLEALGMALSTPDFNSVLRAVLPTLLRSIESETSFEESMALSPVGSNTSDLPLDPMEQVATAGSKVTFASQSQVRNTSSSNATERGRRTSSTAVSPTFQKTSKILQKLVNLSEMLGEFRRDLIPFVIKILDSASVSVDVRRDALCTVMQLASDPHLLQEFASRLVHPLLRLVSTTETSMQNATFTALSCLVCRLGTGYVPYIIPVRRKTRNLPPREGGGRSARLEEYEALVGRLLKQRPLPPDPADLADITMRYDDRVRIRRNSAKSIAGESSFVINVQSLETAWALSGRSNASDLVEWMRRLSIELIRQSPSPLIRSCWALAKTYRPIAEQLFNPSLHSVWEELFSGQRNDVVDNNQLVVGIEMALQSPHVPVNILVALLNLAEFMEMQDKRLPIDVRLLSRQAEAANMYAKALRYREMEFASRNVEPSTECVDALISINNQLGLGDRAVGVLQNLKVKFPNMEIRPLWLEKLFRWDDARNAYEEQIEGYKQRATLIPAPTGDTSGWIASELGKLRCLQALGEFEELEDCAKALKAQIRALSERDVEEAVAYSGAPLVEVRRLGANAAWMLGRWGSMGEFLEGGPGGGSEDLDGSGGAVSVQLENNVSFFRAVMAIHEQEYDKASALIADTRRALSDSISYLLSKSYSRGYRAMVTMQVLAEMEEVVDYRQAVAKAATDLEASKGGADGAGVLGIRGFGIRTDGQRTGSRQSPIAFSTGAVDLGARKASLIRKWRDRLKWAPREIDIYRQILAVHTLVAEPAEDLDSWLELVTLCRKEGMHSLCSNILRKLGAPLPSNKRKSPSRTDADLEREPPQLGLSPSVSTDFSEVNDRVLFNTFKYWWSVGEKTRALAELTAHLKHCPLPTALGVGNHNTKDATMFRVHCLLKRADWMRELNGDDVTEILATLMEARELASDHYWVWHAWAVANYDQLKRTADNTKKDSVVSSACTSPRNTTSSSGHAGPLVSFSTPTASMPKSISTPVQQQQQSSAPFAPFATPRSTTGKFSYLTTPRKLSSSSGSASLLNLLSIQQVDAVSSFVVEAIKGFVRSINLGQGQPVANVLQDTLRLITLWFSYGTKSGVSAILERELEKISPDNWLSVTPQLIARIHIKSPEISNLLRRLLCKVAVAHPQALVSPISVAMNTNDSQQRAVATEVLAEMRKLRSQLVEEATMVSRELMRVAITPHELWYDGLEQAAQLYMDAKDIQGMVGVLRELHEAMNEAPVIAPGLNGSVRQSVVPAQEPRGALEGIGKIGSSTLRDISFRHCYSKMLLDAQEWLDSFRRTGRTTDLHQAWEVYQQVFKRIKGQIAALKKLELHHISPALTLAANLSLGVPGTYKASSTDICIQGFSPAIDVIASKQRPRKITILGSDGQQYPFLLKGHEDLRQDERVMQLFGLINVCLDNDRITNDRGLNIVRYSVLPLSNNSGVIGWVQNCDTMNQLVKQYREAKEIRLLLEMKLLQSKSLGYDKLPLLHKVELFQQVLAETSGRDLAKMLWLKSKTSDVWVERRASFTKSLAVMSMVGYILGLGDRHPSNLMVDRVTGRVVHIDFGDCFEITATRAKYPEIVPFRLTRMLTNCMESSGTEGAYKLTCVRVMRVLRDNRDSVMAMLEAFVYDPLISWRLLAQSNAAKDADAVGTVPPLSRSNSMDDDSTAEGAAAAARMQKSPVDKLRDVLAASPLLSGLDGDEEAQEGRDDFQTSQSEQHYNSPKRLPLAAVASTLREAPLRRGMSVGEVPQDGDEPLQENLNARALEVINRIQAKLTGRDFARQDDSEELSVEQQVNRLVQEATSVENLCQLFTGWCPLW